MLITLEQAKRHLGIALTDTSRDNDITMKANAASDAILNYLKLDATSPLVAWDDSNARPRWQQATLLLLGRFDQQRGDDEGNDEACWKAIERLLIRDRDPALA